MSDDLRTYAAAARADMDPRWDATRHARVLRSALRARTSRVTRRQAARAACSAIAGAYIVLVAIRGLGSVEAPPAEEAAHRASPSGTLRTAGGPPGDSGYETSTP